MHFTAIVCYTLLRRSGPASYRKRAWVLPIRAKRAIAMWRVRGMNIEKMFERGDVEQLVQAFLLLEGADDVRAFLTDLCTPREICDFAQRLQVARYLDEGEPYVEVQARTGASSTTVSRVSKALNGEYGGYRRVLVRLGDDD